MIFNQKFGKYVLLSKSSDRFWNLFLAIAFIQVVSFSVCALFISWLDLLTIVDNGDICIIRTCKDLLSEVHAQICTNYLMGEFTGDLCPALCDGEPQVQLFSCPDMYGHNGKDCVISAISAPLNRSLIIKSRVLTIEALLGTELSQFKRTQSPYLRDAIPRMLSDRLEPHHLSNFSAILHLMCPWPSKSNQVISNNELLNLWLLMLDNEYVLSKSRQKNRIFPQVLSTCGHFYSVQFVDPIIDFTYFIPHILSFQIRSTREKIQLAIDLLHFLRRFITSKPKLELCDVKYNHFGYINHFSLQRDLVLLDSDMIYPLDTVNRSIYSIANCVSDDDCHFIDCQGECYRSSCRLSHSDSDLKRVCRNLFFMGELYGLLEFGLFTFSGFEDSVRKLNKLCFDQQNTLRNNTDLFNLGKMLNILNNVMSQL